MEGLGHQAFVHRRAIVALALLGTLAAAWGARDVFDVVEPFGFSDPDSESARAYDRLEAATGEQAVPGVVLLVDAEGPVSAPAGQAAIASAASELESIEGVARVLPTDESLVSADGRSALVVGTLESSVGDASKLGEEVEQRFGDDPAVTAGGSAVASHQLNGTTEEDLQRIELYAAPLLLLLSLFIFRGLVAAALPLVVGAISIVTTLLILRVLASAIEIDAFAINIVTGLGLGLAIDYSLFIVSRYREELEEKGPTGAALRATMGSVGRMVLFSGLTVAVALASLCVFPQRFLYSIGLGGALVALASAMVCLLVLPAVLAALGPRVNALAPRGLRHKPKIDRWYRVGRFVLDHPLPIATVAVAVMILAGIPSLRLELTRADAAVLPEEKSAHQVDLALRTEFESDPSSRIVVLIEGTENEAQAVGAASSLEQEEGVATVAPVRKVNPGLLRTDIELSEDPFSDTAVALVDQTRELDWGGASLVGGPPAELADQRESLKDHLPAALAIIVISTLLLLFYMTRSVLLPLVALVMNALTVCVAFGVLVFVFQDGRFEGLFDYTSQGALDTSMPILLFAVAFGLSTDYGVFLLQRITEERSRGISDEEAIAVGLARSGRQITAAAVLFAVAMGALVFSELVYVKEVAVGTAVAVLVDATVVRVMLLPAVLRLLGSRIWWAPGSLARPRRARVS